MSVLLAINNLRVAFAARSGNKLVLDDVNLEIQRGQAVGLVGESGSGKSTTARAILAALPPSAQRTGAVLFDGSDVLTMRPDPLRALRARSVTMIGQNPATVMNPLRRVRDFACEALTTNVGVSRQEAYRRVVGLLGDLGIRNPERILNQYPHQLSGGMLQRVVIAASVSVEPRLIIADEPTSALDVTTQAEVVAILEQARRRRHAAMLFITHDLDLAASVCDRIAVMYAGRVVEEQPSHLLQQAPLHPYTAGLANARTRADIDIPRLEAIPGRPVAAYEVTAGCAFAPRCRFAQTRCSKKRPETDTVADSKVACWRHDELAEHLHAPFATPFAAGRQQS